MIKLALSIFSSLILAIIVIFLFAAPPTDIQFSILKTLVIVCFITIFLCFFTSEIADNYSQTDKIWSIIPIIYAWIITYMSDFNSRLIFMSVLITIWGIRLTYNFSRMGGYSWKFWTGHEDYRWRIVKSKPGLNKPIIWKLFNLLFIAGYQNVLLLLITLPLLSSVSEDAKPINFLDMIIAAGILLLILFETIADQQQWNFQKEKKRRIQQNEELGDSYSKGFVHKGLWSFSRHPNYFAEQSIWVLIYLFSVNATDNWGNYSIIGCLLLIILFQGSSFLSEQISESKYPEFKNYKKKVRKFLPVKRFKK